MPILVLDWDETITTKDTTSLIAQIAETNSPKEVPFLYFTNKYLASYGDLENLFQSEYGRINSIETEIHFQRQLKNVELESINRLEHHDFFKGVHIRKFREVAKQIELKANCAEVLRNWTQPIYVLSINWCKTLIEERLHLEGIKNVNVLANDLQLENDITTGKFDVGTNIRTGYDKLQILKRLRIDHPNEKLIYVGDSHGDVLPIIEADIGVVIENGRGIKQLKQIFGEIEEVSLCNIRELSGIYTGSWLQLAALFKQL